MRPVKYGYAISDDYIMSLWDTEENIRDNIDPAKVSCGNKKKAHFKCPKCKHKWFTSVCYIFEGTSCPKCRSKKKKKKVVHMQSLPAHPIYNILCDEYLASSWDYEKNKVSPDNISVFSTRYYHWLCPKCHHSWRTSPYRRCKYLLGCPKCSK